MSFLRVYNTTTSPTSSTSKSLSSHKVVRWRHVVAHKIVTSTSIQSYCRGYCSRKRLPNSLTNVIRSSIFVIFDIKCFASVYYENNNTV